MKKYKMDREELRTYKEKTGYSLGQLELDYYQNYILSKLYEKFNTLYFKGGTCLQKCYGVKRFSDDLDFNYKYLDINKVITLVENIFEEKISDYHATKFGESFSIRFKGILYQGNPIELCKISFDFRQGDTFLEPLKKIIRPIYHDLNSYLLLALSEEEILAEKVRAIMTRYKARDIFDLNELLMNGTKINFDLINKKLSSYSLKFDESLFLEKIEDKKSIFHEEMNKLTKVFPNFEECQKLIKNKFFK